MTATYWEIGRRDVEADQSGRRRANYGDGLIERQAHDLSAQFGRGFGWRNLFQMGSFYLAWQGILQVPSAILTIRSADKNLQALSAKSVNLAMIAERLPLPWSAYGKFTYSDAGQMRLCLNYAREYWTHEGENSPVGLVLCAEKNLAVTQY